MLRAVNDMVFKFIFGEESRRELLRELVNLVLERVGLPLAATVTIRNPFSMRKFPSDKEVVLDIEASDDSGRLFDVEMQVTPQQSYGARALYYWSRVNSAQLSIGSGYEALHPVIGIHILDFVMRKDKPRFIKVFRMADIDDSDPDNRFILTDQATLISLEIPLIDPSADCGRLENLLQLLGSEGGDKTMIQSLIERDEFFAKVDEAYNLFHANPELMSEYESHQKWLHDQATYLAEATAKGLKEGKAEGKAEDARNLKQLGVALDVIEKATGLSQKVIEGL
ncbi:MAG: Rpn family recombination-promoting nuclease/putative transposase [Rectinemataceae bacterium]